MSMTIATWNINSVRLRAEQVGRLLREHAPDVLCLQECKSPVELMALDAFRDLGYEHVAARGQKSYNGVAILSKIPLVETQSLDFVNLGHARHIAARLDNGVTVHNFYVPAGGNIPDRETNEKFGQKLDYLAEMRDWLLKEAPMRTILVGDLNIAPLPEDVWDHKKMVKIISHTPAEVAALQSAQDAGAFVDVVRQNIPDGLLFSWWSYRARDWDAADKGRRLDHIWATPDLAPRARNARILRDVRGWQQPSDHAPVLTDFDI